MDNLEPSSELLKKMNLPAVGAKKYPVYLRASLAGAVVKLMVAGDDKEVVEVPPPYSLGYVSKLIAACMDETNPKADHGQALR